MQFLVDHIWIVLIVLFLIWLADRFMSKFSGTASRRMDASYMNEKIRRMEDGDFTDEDLKILLPYQRVLAIQIVKDKYKMNVPEATAYVDRVAATIGLKGEDWKEVKPLTGLSVGRRSNVDGGVSSNKMKTDLIKPDAKATSESKGTLN